MPKYVKFTKATSCQVVLYQHTFMKIIILVSVEVLVCSVDDVNELDDEAEYKYTCMIFSWKLTIPSS